MTQSQQAPLGVFFAMRARKCEMEDRSQRVMEASLHGESTLVKVVYIKALVVCRLHIVATYVAHASQYCASLR